MQIDKSKIAQSIDLPTFTVVSVGSAAEPGTVCFWLQATSQQTWIVNCIFCKTHPNNEVTLYLYIKISVLKRGPVQPFNLLILLSQDTFETRRHFWNHFYKGMPLNKKITERVAYRRNRGDHFDNILVNFFRCEFQKQHRIASVTTGDQLKMTC